MRRCFWTNFAAIHGNANAFNLCPHGNWYFLPWHRAFLLMYERTVRQLTGHNDFALPYWDWTADRQLPAAFSQPTWNGQPNPLYESQRSMSPTDSLPDEIVGQGVIATILGETPFETFGTSRPSSQDSLDQSWINCEGCGVSGTRLARRRLLQLRDAVSPSLNDGVVQLQIAERTALRRLPLRERNDAWYLRCNGACPDGATVK
jgi:hypothetical protein